MTVIALIPARGGSKRIPGKNLKSFCGRPIILRVFEALALSGISEKNIYCSTDSPDIKTLVHSVGGSLLDRPESLAHDNVGIIDVIKFCLQQIETVGFTDDKTLFLVAYPTAVYARPDLIQNAVEIARKHPSKLVVSSTQIDSSVSRSFYLSSGNSFPLNKDFYSFRSQDLPALFLDAGQFYVGSVGLWRTLSGTTNHPDVYPFVVENAVDINTFDDWIKAEKEFSN